MASPKPRRSALSATRTAAPGGDQGFRLLELVPDAVFLCDSAGKIVFVNRRAEVMSGYNRRQMLGRPIEMLVPQGLRAAHRRSRIEYMAGPRDRPMGSIDHDFEFRRRSGSTFSADIALGPIETPGGTQTMAVVRDITERRKLEVALAHQALHDPLTGLANRTLFFDRLRQAMLLAHRDRKQVALVMLDLDHFKSVNDAYGHQAGDQVLRRVAHRLSRGLRSSDTVARIGGDEFAWVFPNVGGRQAAAVMMAKLMRALPARFRIGDSSIEIGVSAGMALYPDDGEDVDALMAVSDVELYAAKRQAPGPPRRRARKS